MTLSRTIPPRSAAPPRPAEAVPTPRHRPDIQGLRAVAVLLVVGSHAGIPGLAGGYVGVDVFFVISGFLITGLLLAESSATGKISAARFFARRAIRLLPLSTLVAALTLGVAWWWLPPARIADVGADALGAASYSINVRLAQVATDYFATTDPSPFQHYWSLAVEEQFYLIWPLLLIAALQIGAVRLHTRRIGGRRVFAVVVSVLCGASFVHSVVTTTQSAPWAYFGSPSRAWELGVGALIAVAESARRTRSARDAPHRDRSTTAVSDRRLLGVGANRSRVAAAGRLGPALLSWIGVAAIVVAALIYDDRTPFPGFAALLPVLGAAAVITGGRVRYPRAFPFLGELSYGWYLWHWPLLILVPALIGHSLDIALRLALCAAALAIAFVTYHLVENPIRHRRALIRRPARGLALGLGLSALTAVSAVTASHHPRPLVLGADAVDTSAAVHTAPAALTRLIAAGESTRLIPANLRPALNDAAADQSRPQRDGCHLSLGSGARPGECVYGPANATRTVVLLGDSHALQWFPALDSIASSAGWRLVSLTRSSCSPAPVAVRNLKLNRRYTECDAWHRWVSQRIDQLRPDLIVVASSTNYLGMLADHPVDPVAEWSAAWDGLFGRLRNDAGQVVVLTDTPTLSNDPVGCLARHSTAIGDCAEPAGTVLRDQNARQAIRDAATRAGVTVIDPTPWLCSSRCPLVVGDLLVYRDTNHLTTAYAQSLAPLLSRALPRPARTRD
ncbi:acyltransferase [Actinoplanes sp. KI2]|uniref:acyltransferase family protein n=1 Tax=Actinoplanes sp. KI2 TaxID=2983315 RepID=UPI0021D601CB|nr:acyltransferase family protein [Actinoplanes sp. KI2]MCU7729291.1 acyltransferase [Actinoplanes sp. KI2]